MLCVHGDYMEYLELATSRGMKHRTEHQNWNRATKLPQIGWSKAKKATPVQKFY